VHADGSGRARFVREHDGLLEHALECSDEGAGREIHLAARREGIHHRDRPARKRLLREHRPGNE
jgi:hypothetical protein